MFICPMISATLILNWKEDGMIYRERLSMSENSSPPPQRFNPIIRGFRLAFVILFIVIDIVQIATALVTKQHDIFETISMIFSPL